MAHNMLQLPLEKQDVFLPNSVCCIIWLVYKKLNFVQHLKIDADH